MRRPVDSLRDVADLLAHRLDGDADANVDRAYALKLDGGGRDFAAHRIARAGATPERAARLRAREGTRSYPFAAYSDWTDGKVMASRPVAAGLRSAFPAPLPKSASDRVDAHARFPQCAGANAETRPVIASARLSCSVILAPKPPPLWSAVRLAPNVSSPPPDPPARLSDSAPRSRALLARLTICR